MEFYTFLPFKRDFDLSHLCPFEQVNNPRMKRLIPFGEGGLRGKMSSLVSSSSLIYCGFDFMLNPFGLGLLALLFLADFLCVSSSSSSDDVSSSFIAGIDFSLCILIPCLNSS